MKIQQKVPFWRMRIEPTWSALSIVAAIFIVLVVMLKHWMQNIDAQVSMNLQTTENTYSLIADKKRKSDLTVETKSLPLEVSSTK